MKLDVVRGRLGRHRFHPMLVHFPSALYPFGVVLDTLFVLTGNASYASAGFYSLLGGVVMSTAAVVYGLIDFMRIDTVNPAWKTSGLHGLLNATWWLVYACLLIYRMKHPEFQPGWLYVAVSGGVTLGLVVSNYLGAELVIRHKIGIE